MMEQRQAAPDETDRAERDVAGPLVSVIVPAYNAEAFIAATLDSVTRQTYPYIEIIVVDDGSTDRTADIVRRFMVRDPRIRLAHQRNAGVAAARNHGIRLACGGLIAPVDADDLWAPTKIERQVGCFLAGDDRLGLVYTRSQFIDEEGRMIRPQSNHPRDPEGMVFRRMIEGNLVGNGSAPLMRKEYVLEAGGYDPGLRACGAEGCEDWKLYLAIAERYAFAIVPDFLVGYRQIPSSMSRCLWAMKRSHDLVMADIRRRHPELPERIFRRSASLLYFWMIGRAENFFSKPTLQLMVAALRKDPLVFTRWALIKRLLLSPFRHPCRTVGIFWPGLTQKLHEREVARRKPFLEDAMPPPVVAATDDPSATAARAA